jgi:hypothetical protein
MVWALLEQVWFQQQEVRLVLVLLLLVELLCLDPEVVFEVQAVPRQLQLLVHRL